MGILCEAEMEIERGEDVGLGPKQREGKISSAAITPCTACRRSGMCYFQLFLRETSIEQVDGRGNEKEGKDWVSRLLLGV